jgi:hypothetical protein
VKRGIRPTSWDVRVAAATVALGALLFGVACVIGAATDEGSVRWATRAARTLPVVPLLGAAVTYLALRRARRRGELLALETLGCSPSRAAAFVVAAATALSVAAAACVVGFRGGAVEAFFPRAAAPTDVHPVADGFADDARGVHIAPGGEMSAAPKKASEPAGRARGRAAAAAVVLLALGAALPLLTARAERGGQGRAVAAAAVTCVLCVFLLQAAAAGRAPPALACVPAVALLVFAALRYVERREAPW